MLAHENLFLSWRAVHRISTLAYIILFKNIYILVLVCYESVPLKEGQKIFYHGKWTVENFSSYSGIGIKYFFNDYTCLVYRLSEKCNLQLTVAH